jgi:hypothetical protein
MSFELEAAVFVGKLSVAMSDSRAPLPLREQMHGFHGTLSALVARVSQQREKMAAFDECIRLRESQRLRAVAIEALNGILAAQRLNSELTQEAMAMENASDSPIIDSLRSRCSLMEFKEVREILGCHRQTLYDYINEGKIEAQPVGSRKKFDPRAVIRYLQGRRTGHRR